MSNNNNIRSARTIDLATHQQMVQDLEATIDVMQQRIQQLEKKDVKATELSYSHEQLLDAYSDMHSTNLSLQQDKETLLLQVKMLQDINLNTQYQLTTLQS